MVDSTPSVGGLRSTRSPPRRIDDVGTRLIFDAGAVARGPASNVR